MELSSRASLCSSPCRYRLRRYPKAAPFRVGRMVGMLLWPPACTNQGFCCGGFTLSLNVWLRSFLLQGPARQPDCQAPTYQYA